MRRATDGSTPHGRRVTVEEPFFFPDTFFSDIYALPMYIFGHLRVGYVCM